MTRQDTVDAGVEHYITQHGTPASIKLRCTCGWSFSVTRRQGRLETVAKVNAAIAEHDRAALAKTGGA